MNVFLPDRNTGLTEKMDNPTCSTALLKNTYRQFKTVNSLISRWNKIYSSEIKPVLNPYQTNTLLDIGFGGGDIPIQLVEWANNDGYDLQITAIDPDPRAFDYISDLSTPTNIDFRKCRLTDLEPANHSYDFIISNHLMHHLNSDNLQEVLGHSQKLCSGRILFNDIRRDDFAYLLFNIFPRPFFRNSFVVEDGLTSIKRSFTESELQELVPSEWVVKTLFPFRLLLAHYA